MAGTSHVLCWFICVICSKRICSLTAVCRVISTQLFNVPKVFICSLKYIVVVLFSNVYWVFRECFGFVTLMGY